MAPEPRGQSAALGQIRAAQNGVINLNIPALEQQTDKGAAHGAAVGPLGYARQKCACM